MKRSALRNGFSRSSKLGFLVLLAACEPPLADAQSPTTPGSSTTSPAAASGTAASPATPRASSDSPSDPATLPSQAPSADGEVSPSFGDSPSCSADASFLASHTVLGGDTRSATLRGDELELFVATQEGALLRSVRAAAGDSFPPGTPLAWTPWSDVDGVGLSNDGLTLYVTARVGDGAHAPISTLFVVRRATVDSDFGAPEAQPLHASGTLTLIGPFPSPDEATLFYTVLGGGGAHVMQTPFGAATSSDSPFFVPPAYTNGSVVSHDGLRMYTAVGQVPPLAPAHNGMFAISLAKRADIAAKFDVPVLLPSLNHVDGVDEIPVWLSADECRLYYLSGTFSHGELRLVTKT